MKSQEPDVVVAMAAYRVAGLFLAAATSFLSAGKAAGIEDGFAAYGRNYETAFREFMPLAAAGDPWAQFSVGRMYDRGRGVPQDRAKAAHWYRLAADQGLAEAQHNLGVMYEKGEGLPQDYAEATRWYQLAAEQGYVETQLTLGILYARGQGVPQDFVLAYMWISLGLAGLPPEGDRESLVEVRAAVARRLTPALLARAQEMARNWRPRVATRSEGKVSAYGDAKSGEPPAARAERTPLEQADILAVQRNLGDLGYDPGPVDGVVGLKTRRAIRAFQSDVGLPADGEISDTLTAALSDATVSGRSVAAPATPVQRRLDGTGTGFAVSQNGHLVTNHHVVESCVDVRVQTTGEEVVAAVVVARDPEDDLALLEAPVRLPAASFRDDRDVRPGDTVVAVGFPLHGLLASEANVTTGTVSALAGIANDMRFLQMTVPVQPGNSGGPLLDLQGRVVGVVVGKLDALRVASLTGDIPQNVNFAIKAGVVQAFLQTSGLAAKVIMTVEEAYGEEPREFSPAAVGAEAKAFTVLVECWR